MDTLISLRIAVIVLSAAYLVGSTIYFAIKMSKRIPNPEAGEKSSLLGPNKTPATGTVITVKGCDRFCIGSIFLTSGKPYITTSAFVTWYIVANVLMAAIFGLGYYMVFVKYF